MSGRRRGCTNFNTRLLAQGKRSPLATLPSNVGTNGTSTSSQPKKQRAVVDGSLPSAKKQRAVVDGGLPSTKKQKASRPLEQSDDSHFTPIKSLFHDGDIDFCLELVEQGHLFVTVCQIDEEAYYSFGSHLNQSDSWEVAYKTRASTGFSSQRTRVSIADYLPAAKGLFEAADRNGRYLNGWVTKYKSEVGSLASHHDKFKYGQDFRAVLTMGSSSSGSKIMRLEECTPNGRWFEIEVPHGTLVTLSKHGSGADRPRHPDGSTIRTETTVNGRPYVKHSIKNAEDTTALLLEFSLSEGINVAKALSEFHSALPKAKAIVDCRNPPYPTPSQIGSKECQQLSLSEKARLANFVHCGTWPLETPQEIECQFKQEGICSASSAHAPDNMLPDAVYCCFCDSYIYQFEDEFSISKARTNMNQHCKTKTHVACKEHGSRKEWDRQVLLSKKKKCIEELPVDYIEMGDDVKKFYCRECNRSLVCSSVEDMKWVKHPRRIRFDGG